MCREDIGEVVASHYTIKFFGGGKRTVHVNYSDHRKPFAITGEPEESDWIMKDGKKFGILLGGNVRGLVFQPQRA